MFWWHSLPFHTSLSVWVVAGGDMLAAKSQQGGHQTNQWQGHTEEAHESDEGLDWLKGTSNHGFYMLLLFVFENHGFPINQFGDIKVIQSLLLLSNNMGCNKSTT